MPTVFSNERWRVVTDMDWTTLYACRRERGAVRSLVRVDDLLSSTALAPRSLHGDILELRSVSQGGTWNRYVNLRTRRKLDGTSSTSDTGFTRNSILLPAGALVTFESRGVPQFGEDRRPRSGTIFAQDGAGKRLVTTGSTFGEYGYSVANAVDGPYDLAMTPRGSTGSVLYFSDGQRAPHRADLNGAATGLDWQRSFGVGRVFRSYPVADRARGRLTPIANTDLGLRVTAHGTRVIERSWIRTGRRLAKLAPGERPQVWMSPARVTAIVAKFAERPSVRRLRVSDRATGGWFEVAAPPAGAELRVHDSGSVAYRDGEDIVVLVAQTTPVPSSFVIQRISAPGGSALGLADSVVYWTDAAGQPRSESLIGRPPSLL